MTLTAADYADLSGPTQNFCIWFTAACVAAAAAIYGATTGNYPYMVTGIGGFLVAVVGMLTSVGVLTAKLIAITARGN